MNKEKVININWTKVSEIATELAYLEKTIEELEAKDLKNLPKFEQKMLQRDYNIAVSEINANYHYMDKELGLIRLANDILFDIERTGLVANEQEYNDIYDKVKNKWLVELLASPDIAMPFEKTRDTIRNISRDVMIKYDEELAIKDLDKEMQDELANYEVR